MFVSPKITLADRPPPPTTTTTNSPTRPPLHLVVHAPHLPLDPNTASPPLYLPVHPPPPHNIPLYPNTASPPLYLPVHPPPPHNIPLYPNTASPPLYLPVHPPPPHHLLLYPNTASPPLFLPVLPPPPHHLPLYPTTDVEWPSGEDCCGWTTGGDAGNATTALRTRLTALTPTPPRPLTQGMCTGTYKRTGKTDETFIQNCSLDSHSLLTAPSLTPPLPFCSPTVSCQYHSFGRQYAASPRHNITIITHINTTFPLAQVVSHLYHPVSSHQHNYTIQE
ncbi:hypothetical protein Pcinc_018799 [Petrolisthes cinctipes]|uniref:Uncharacterized protein n=1 Tax=Petrolisthes cinctipes TaxID=88211 RepID=A0AAE1KL85_PETCI|nr:hypothetical protein Pcinc_018799 [Petrolisthes cinctipes]